MEARKMKTVHRRAGGFTLIEMMIVIAILAVVAAIGIPLYQDYVQTARIGTLMNNAATLSVFQEDLLVRTGAYGAGTYDAGGGIVTLTTATGWQPRGDDDTVYVVTANAGVSYQVTATDSSGQSVCRVYPAKTACP